MRLLALICSQRKMKRSSAAMTNPHPQLAEPFPIHKRFLLAGRALRPRSCARKVDSRILAFVRDLMRGYHQSTIDIASICRTKYDIARTFYMIASDCKDSVQ